MKKKKINIIERYISGEANEPETIWVEKQFASGELEPFLKKKVKRDWKDFNSTEEIDLSYLFEKVLDKINEKGTASRTVKLNRVLDIYLKVAAILLLPLVIAGSIFFFSQHQKISILSNNISTSTINAPPGSRITFELPDGSHGYLNSGSTLTYSIPFNENRKVELKGEAWFSVVKDRKNPFEVKAGNSTIEVLGTSFNLTAYPEDNYIEVVLEEGSVAFKADPKARITHLKPNERLLFKDKSITIDKVEPKKYSGWTKGELVFRGDKMEEIARRLERWYNIKVIITNEKLLDYSFRGTFIDAALEDVLNLLSMTSPLEYNIKPAYMNSNDNWEKETVIFSIKK